MIGRVTPVFQDVAGLAVERLADPLQRLETHAPDLAVTCNGPVRFSCASPRGDLLGRADYLIRACNRRGPTATGFEPAVLNALARRRDTGYAEEAELDKPCGGR